MTPSPSSRTRPVTRPAARHELRTLRDVLARAFWDDPLVTWIFPVERDRYARLRWFFAMDLATFDRKGLVVTTDDLAATSLWSPPGTWQVTPADVARVGHLAVRAFGHRVLGSLRILEAFDRVHPAEPHWYLGTIGTDPGRQGAGAGRAVIEHVLERADAEGTPAYLESSKEQNLPYYERFGFRVTSEQRLPDGGPPFWPMWRDPR